MPGRVVVVGLGPAGADHVLPVARRALEGASVRFARTARHPAVAELVDAGIAFESFDAVYDAAPDLEPRVTAELDIRHHADAGDDEIGACGDVGRAETQVDTVLAVALVQRFRKRRRRK